MTNDINTRMPSAPTAADWRKSSYCTSSSSCVEISQSPSGTAMRDTKDPDGPQLSFDTTSWAQFVTGVRAGEFNPDL